MTNLISSIYVEIPEGAKAEAFSGTYIDKNGVEKPFTINSLPGCYLHYGAKYPLPVSVPLGDDHTAPNPGEYDIDPLTFFEVGQRGRLALGRNWRLTARSRGK